MKVKQILAIALFILCMWMQWIHLVKADPLPLDDAFQLHATIQDANTLLLKWDIANQYYLYDQIDVKESEGLVTIGQLRKPKSIKYEFPYLGKKEVYEGTLSIGVPLLGTQPGETTLEVYYQGCSFEGYCYPPVTRTLNVAFNENLALSKVQINSRFMDIIHSGHLLEDSSWFRYVGDSTLGFVLLFFILGILMSLTPCVLPMVPIVSSLITAQKNLTAMKGFLLSLVYVLSMASTYAVIGLFIGYFGSHLQIWFQQSWVIVLLSLFLFLLSLSMFEIFMLQLPQAISHKVMPLFQRLQGGQVVTVALMGILATLVVTPCVTPPLIGAISYIGYTGDTLLGAITLFSLGLGLGLPLLIVGTSLAKWMPKTGPWMEWIKVMIGFFMMAVAMSLFMSVLDKPWENILWSLLIVFIIYVIIYRLKSKALIKYRWILLVLTLVTFALFIYLLNKEPSFSRIFSVSDKELIQENGLNYYQVKHIKSLDILLTKARDNKTTLIIDYYAEWCTYCKKFHQEVLYDKEVQAKIKDWWLVLLDVTDSDQEALVLLRRYQVVAPPTIIFLNEQGLEIRDTRLIGDINKETFLRIVDEIKKDKSL